MLIDTSPKRPRREPPDVPWRGIAWASTSIGLGIASGFVEGVARPGDRIVALGNRSLNGSERRMKAVRVTVNDRRFDIYPERIGRS